MCFWPCCSIVKRYEPDLSAVTLTVRRKNRNRIGLMVWPLPAAVGGGAIVHEHQQTGSSTSYLVRIDDDGEAVWQIATNATGRNFVTDGASYVFVPDAFPSSGAWEIRQYSLSTGSLLNTINKASGDVSGGIGVYGGKLFFGWNNYAGSEAYETDDRAAMVCVAASTLVEQWHYLDIDYDPGYPFSSLGLALSTPIAFNSTSLFIPVAQKAVVSPDVNPHDTTLFEIDQAAGTLTSEIQTQTSFGPGAPDMVLASGTDLWWRLGNIIVRGTTASGVPVAEHSVTSINDIALDTYNAGSILAAAGGRAQRLRRLDSTMTLAEWAAWTNMTTVSEVGYALKRDDQGRLWASGQLTNYGGV